MSNDKIVLRLYRNYKHAPVIIYNKELNKQLSLHKIWKDVLNYKNTCIIAQQAKKYIGLALLRKKPQWKRPLLEIAILTSYHDQGLEERLIRRAILESWLNGYSEIDVYCNKKTRKLYENFGFTLNNNSKNNTKSKQTMTLKLKTFLSNNLNLGEHL